MLEHVKRHLHLDGIEDEYLDGELQELIEAALIEIQRGTGIVVTKDDFRGMLVLKMLVAHDYENKSGESTVAYPPRILALMRQMADERRLPENEDKSTT